MLNIRCGLFETNSSSVHSITVLTANEYARWKNGTCVIQSYSSNVISKESAISRALINTFYMNDKDIEQELANRGYYTYDTFHDIIGDRYETSETKVTKDGQELVIVSYSGYDG